MKRLHKFLLLRSTDRRLLVRTALLLAAVRLGLWILPFQTLRRLLARVTDTHAGSCNANSPSPDQIAWAVALASRSVPKATCLTQALTAQVLLKREGYPACLRIGVARSESRQLLAHAWVEIQGKAVTGGSELGHYTLLAVLKEEGR